MSKIRLRQKQLLIAGGIGGLSVLLICILAGILYVNHLTGKLNGQRQAVELELEQTQQVMKDEYIAVEVVTRDIESGETIRANDLETKMIQKSVIADDEVLSKELISGKVAKIKLPHKSPVTASVIYEDEVTTRDIRNQEFSLIELPIKLKKNDYVDVRIKLPSGQDYIVLSKKRVEDLQNGTVWYQMSEKEILNMSSAIVDAYINDASIYALTYVEPGIQEKAYTTYPANKSVLDLIDSDPNIIQKATTELERRNRVKLEEALNAMTPQQRQDYKSNRNTQQTAEEQAAKEQTTYQQQSNDLMNETSTTQPENTETIFNDQNSVGGTP
ncbi:SAF domain-containing protein [Paenibacillus hubeiensis]|uniref:SAF domain-containing protein n=1 Tax=Paenibacillus hubeiensis TaxID=3077330 RepID=UPI0031BA0CB7